MTTRLSNNKISRAQKVVAFVNKFLPHKFRKEGWIEAYSNGREQGLSIKFFIKLDKGIQDFECLQFCFSEYRRSDDIVVYTGTKYADFSMQGNVPSENTYANKRFFGGDVQNGEESAARYITEMTIKMFEKYGEKK